VTRHAVSMITITYTAWFSMRTCAPRVRAPSSGYSITSNQPIWNSGIFASGARPPRPVRAWSWRVGRRVRGRGVPDCVAAVVGRHGTRAPAPALSRVTHEHACAGVRAGRLIASLTDLHRVCVLLPELYIAMVRRGHLRVRREVALLELPP
jgi:hypothetical protein